MAVRMENGESTAYVSLNGSQLKIIAMATMLIDHAGAIFYPSEMIWRAVGRLSFPIFCFLLVEGFYHSRDLRKYIIRMLCFSVLSEIPYDLAFRGKVLEFGHQNAFFTLLLGLLAMYAMQQTNRYWIKLLDLGLVMYIANFCHTDYGYRGILLIAIYYFWKEYKWLALLLGSFWNFLYQITVQYYGIFAAFPLFLYNGKRGMQIKYLFYLVYPLHLLLYWWIKTKL